LISDELYAELLAEALWIKNFDRDLMENAVLKALATAFGKKD